MEVIRPRMPLSQLTAIAAAATAGRQHQSAAEERETPTTRRMTIAGGRWCHR
jgi:hypothetical protein